MLKKNKNFFKGLHNLLKAITSSNEDTRRREEAEEMTTKEVARLIEWAKENGYTLDEILNLIKYIATNNQ